ncbi:MAG: hypothetical protein JNK01_21055 [Devosia sp.]|nr:hypothetical protein [Devosia sp.]
MDGISIRPWLETDSAVELTELLHRAYARLAAMNLRFWATHQSAEVTEKRIASGECFVAVADGVICGTILFRDASRTSGSPLYDRPDVAHQLSQRHPEQATRRRVSLSGEAPIDLHPAAS